METTEDVHNVELNKRKNIFYESKYLLLNNIMTQLFITLVRAVKNTENL